MLGQTTDDQGFYVPPTGDQVINNLYGLIAPLMGPTYMSGVNFVGAQTAGMATPTQQQDLETTITGFSPETMEALSNTSLNPFNNISTWIWIAAIAVGGYLLLDLWEGYRR
jgi:hypothetical protein